MGNICRSPTAEGVLRHKLREAGLHELVVVDSAGTHAYHVGEPPDQRSSNMPGSAATTFQRCARGGSATADFAHFDLMLAMDFDNFSLLEAQCPPEHRAKLAPLSEFARRHDSPVVPDPYYSGADGFERVLDLIEDACEGLVDHLRAG
jgi:protein-tyrosine phosphatase